MASRTRTQQVIPPVASIPGRYWIMLAGWVGSSQVPGGSEMGFRAVAVVAKSTRLVVYLSAEIETTFGLTVRKDRYTVITPAGAVEIASVDPDAGPGVVAIDIAAPLPPSAECVLTIDAGTMRSVGGASLPAAALPFDSPPAAPPMTPLVAVPSGSTLRVWCTAQIDPGAGAPTSPTSYTIVAPDGPLSVVSAEIDSGGLAVLLTLSREVPDENCTVTVGAGALVSVDGAANDAAVLSFRGATPGPGPGPVDPPVVDGWSPPIGSRIERGQEIAFEVTSPGGVETVIAWVRFDELRAADLVFDGRTFRGHYVGTVEEIPDGRRFTIRRASGGWMSRPVIVVHATNCHGEETTYVHG